MANFGRWHTACTIIECNLITFQEVTKMNKVDFIAGDKLNKAPDLPLAHSESGPNVISTVKDSVATGLATAAERVHEKADTTEEYLNSKAEKVHEIAQHAFERVNKAGHKTADMLSTTSDYVKDLDLREKRQQLRSTISHRPELSIAIAGIFGLAVGVLLGRRTSR